MRCPKCSYISFDRQKSCGKCGNDLTAAAEQLKGTGIKATAPFFLGAVLGKQKKAEAEPGPVPREEEELLTLDELETQGSAADEEELDFAGAPLDEDDLEEQSMQSLGLGDIDLSDLVPPREQEEETQEEESPPVQSQTEEDSQFGIDLSSAAEPDDLVFEEQAQGAPGGGEETATSEGSGDEDIIDLSSLMSFDETPAPPAAKEEEFDILDLSQEDEPEGLSLESDEEPHSAPEPAKKKASLKPDIPDLGLTLESDDK